MVKVATFGMSDLLTVGPSQVPTRAHNVFCPDGMFRSARVTGPADTHFSLPASVKVRGVSVSGFLAFDSDRDCLRFHPYAYRTNAKMLPDLSRACIRLEVAPFGCHLVRLLADGKPTERTYLIQDDSDRVGFASTFGLRNEEEDVQRASAFLDRHVGRIVEDPGYFDIIAD